MQPSDKEFQNLLRCNDNNTTVVVLAGGSGSRIAEVSKGAPKPLLSVLGTPIIRRVIEHAHQSKLNHILISTTPDYYAIFSAWLELLPPPQNTLINLVSNPLHRDGPAAALIGLQASITSPLTLLVLGDILFKRNPIRSLLRIKLRDDVGFLGCMKVPVNHLIRRGAVLPDSQYGIRLIARPRRPILGAYAWSGSALFPTAWLRSVDHRDFVGKPVDYLFGTARRLAMFAVPPFVNINTPLDLVAASILLATRRQRHEIALMLNEQGR